MTNDKEFEIRGRDGFYVRRQVTANTLELVVGHDRVAGGLWNEWVNDGQPERETRNQARRMIAEARRNGLEESA